MESRFKSRKFWMSVVTGLIIVANEGLGLNLPKEALMSVAGVVMAYVIGQGIADKK